MNCRLWTKYALLSGLCTLGIAHAENWSIAPPMANHMVLPHGKTLPLRGKGPVGQTVQIHFMNHESHAVVADTGDWKITLPSCEATAIPQTMHIRCGAESHDLSDILVGEVWLFSGQSNMDFPLIKAIGGQQALATAGKQPLVRLLHLAGLPTDQRRYDEAELQRLSPEKFYQGTWQPCSAAAAAPVSAIAWWTAVAIAQKKNIPLGIIENAVGGSGTEAWLSPEALDRRDEYAALQQDWLNAPRMSSWARQRARFNLGPHLQAHHPYQPSFLFQATQHQLSDFPLTCVVWYQGETNAESADYEHHLHLITDLIRSWRSSWQQADLPFYLIELPRIGGSDPLRRHWPLYRKVQRAAATLPHVSLIPTTDIGYDSPDVHPPDKFPIAQRLAEEILRQP